MKYKRPRYARHLVLSPRMDWRLGPVVRVGILVSFRPFPNALAGHIERWNETLQRYSRCCSVKDVTERHGLGSESGTGTGTIAPGPSKGPTSARRKEIDP